MAATRLDHLARSLLVVPSRRSIVGLALAGVAAPLLGMADRAAAKKKKRKKCPKHPICPAECTVWANHVDGGTACATSTALQLPCRLCASDSDCNTDPQYRLCLISHTIHPEDGSDPFTEDFSSPCGFAYPDGICGMPIPCVIHG